MRTQGEHIRTLQRRVDFLKAREHRNSYDQAELGALEWALVSLPPAQRTWVGLSDEESTVIWANSQSVDEAIRATEKQLMENNI